MEWVNTFLLIVRGELEAAQAECRRLDTLEAQARHDATEAGVKKLQLERILAALDALDPTTSVPDVPL